MKWFRKNADRARGMGYIVVATVVIYVASAQIRSGDEGMRGLTAALALVVSFVAIVAGIKLIVTSGGD